MVKHETERLLTSNDKAHVLLCWVFARPQLYEPFLALAHDVRLVHLVCSAGELESSCISAATSRYWILL